jgi:hypothetical protein
MMRETCRSLGFIPVGSRQGFNKDGDSYHHLVRLSQTGIVLVAMWVLNSEFLM